MDYKGTLTIKLRQEANYQVVSIKDSGCGIRDDIKEKIFKLIDNSERTLPIFIHKCQKHPKLQGLSIIWIH